MKTDNSQINKNYFLFRFIKILNYIFLIFFFIFFSNSNYCQNPSNISGLKLWLKSDTGVIVNGTNVITWKDISGNFYDANQSIPIKQPSISNNVLNGISAIHFNGNQILNGVTIPNLASSSLTVFIVASGESMYDPYNVLFDLGPYAPGGFWVSKHLDNLTIYSNNTIYSSSSNLLNSNGFSTKIFGYKKEIGVNSESLINTNFSGNSTNSLIVGPFVNGSYNIGGDPTYFGNWSGNIFEIILFDKLINSTEENTINNYLINKYSPYLNLGSDIFINPTFSCTPINSSILYANPNFKSFLWSNGDTTNQIFLKLITMTQ
jgi:hypothetical protein